MISFLLRRGLIPIMSFFNRRCHLMLNSLLRTDAVVQTLIQQRQRITISVTTSGDTEQQQQPPRQVQPPRQQSISPSTNDSTQAKVNGTASSDEDSESQEEDVCAAPRVIPEVARRPMFRPDQEEILEVLEVLQAPAELLRDPLCNGMRRRT